MTRINEIISGLQKIAANPGKAVADYTKETGKGAVGICYLYAPDEIFHAAGYLPVGMWGASVPISKARTHLPPFGCSVMQAVMELECGGVYDILKAVVFSVPCDTLKCMSQMWKGKCPSLTFCHPQNRKLEAANVFLTEEYRKLKERFEAITGEKIPDAAIEKSIEVYNANRAVMREFTDVAAEYPDIFDPIKRHAVIKSRFFMEKSRHTALVSELIAEVRKQPKKPWPGKKVILSGIMAEPDGFLDVFREFNLAVVADDLAQEGRQYRVDVPALPGREPLYRLAKWWQDFDGCSLATDLATVDAGKFRNNMLVDMTKKYKADGVVICMMKFCDPEEFDYPVLYPALDKAGVPNLMVEVDLEVRSFEQVKTRVQTFRDILG
ncbi:MAG: 2-hydroxyacyl-CoA dehydratase family protein [Deltaproteobacteria bacterium]|jgi:benzoyl-CoA reductase/2-hydroxyglutaryl-CoA dehydratase subunit BcrC/BadD/HgdB|nr:2-hydroxyacyl-CoA dehydratase family protein [Deltaproteobacteria bacterium]